MARHRISCIIPLLFMASGCDRAVESSQRSGENSVTTVVENVYAPPVGSQFALPEVGGSDTVYDVSLQDPDELRALLTRLEQLASRPKSQNELPEIALVLHGPEIELFAIDNYQEFRDVVDLAAKLDALKIIEVKMCQTQMRSLGLDDDDIPGFIELVPFGPGEVERLVDEGYVTM